MQSKINLELKHYCSDFKKIRMVLKELGAKREIVKNQKDYFFNLPNVKGKQSPRLKLRIESKSMTLIYYERPSFKKSKSMPSLVKLYDVIDSRLLDFLGSALGVKAVVEKRREVWRKENTVFHLDTIRGVGKIFEVELQKIGKIRDSDRNLFRDYQKLLNPFLGEVISGSNLDLIINSRKS